MRNSSVGLGRGQAEIHYLRLMATILPSAAEPFSFANWAGAGAPVEVSKRPESSRLHTWISMVLYAQLLVLSGLPELHNGTTAEPAWVTT